MAGFNFITVRLGKDSIPDIKQICSSYVGILSEPLIINVKCTQVPDNYGHDDYAFLWLGSDNNKGMPTNWKQGFKAVGRVKNVLRGKNYNDTSVTTIEIVYIFRESVNRMDILRCAPTAYYWCSSMPLIGLDDHANQTIRNMSGSAFSDLRAFFSAIDSVANYFKNDILQIEPGFEQYFDYPLPDPQLYPNIKSLEDINFELNVKRSTCALQQIFYGAPGTGKSNTIKSEVDQKDLPRVRTTFHPDSDYSTFVGAYKPTSVEVPMMTMIGTKAVPVENPDGTPRIEKKIVYEFVPQAFLKAYTGAWKNQDKPFFLIIEEINRGNCAQIFGDLFQLLDRNDETGLSDYPISPDEDIQKFLLTDKKYGFAALTEEQKAYIPSEVLSGELLVLPKNLHIWATMNTSDQSLFPIDSAFKRRWDWQYIPISNARKEWQIEANNKRYDWWDFLQKMNDKIGSTTNSEDKKLGYFFCKAKNGIIDAETFVGKVVFYIWNDVFKDFAEEAGDLFKDSSDPQNPLLSFNKFYTVGMDGKTKVVEEKVELFLQNLGLSEISDVSPTSENLEELDKEGNNFDRYSLNGSAPKGKSDLGLSVMTQYLEQHPDMAFEEIRKTFPDGMLGNIAHKGLIVKADAQLDSYTRYYTSKTFTSSDGVAYKIYKQWTVVNIDNIIEFAKEQGWSVEKAKSWQRKDNQA